MNYKFNVGQTVVCNGKGKYKIGTKIKIFSRHNEFGFNHYQDSKGSFHREQDLDVCPYGGEIEDGAAELSRRYMIVSAYMNNQTDESWRDLLENVSEEVLDFISATRPHLLAP